MRKIIIIGTLHAGLTVNRELQELLEKYSPDQILLEITQKDVRKEKLKSYPPEMRFALTWAKRTKFV